jgi:hypothetical protein
MSPRLRATRVLVFLLAAGVAGCAAGARTRATNASVVVVARGMLQGALTPIG